MKGTLGWTRSALRTSAAPLPPPPRLLVLALVRVPQTINLVVVQGRHAHRVQGRDGQDVVQLHHGRQHLAGLPAAHDFFSSEANNWGTAQQIQASNKLAQEIITHRMYIYESAADMIDDPSLTPTFLFRGRKFL